MTAEKKKPGRKKKSESAKKNKYSIYLTNGELENISQRAEKENEEVSPFIVKKALGF